MNAKEKVLFSEEQETLLIPLACKADPESRLFFDPQAQQVLERVDYDFENLQIPMQTRVTVGMRAAKMDEWVQQFVLDNPEAVVLHLGCGLDGRFGRLDNGHLVWYDLDMPLVIDLRRKFFEETARYHMLASSVTELDWVDEVAATGRPVMIVAEGLLMYLKEEDVKALLLRLQAAFPGCRLVCDVFSEMTASRVGKHPSVRKTGAHVQWGVDDLRALETWQDGICLLEEWYFSQSDLLQNLSWNMRLAFKLAGLFAVANKAHRLAVFKLGGC